MAYITTKTKRQQIKNDVFDLISPGKIAVKCGREMYRLQGVVIHARFCASGAGNYKFNINHNTLHADYEVWICGSKDHWYLIPIDSIRNMYNHPAAYPDNHHPGIRVVSVDATTHLAGYASPSIKLDLTPYFQASLSMG
jgi:hypothetical protein